MGGRAEGQLASGRVDRRLGRAGVGAGRERGCTGEEETRKAFDSSFALVRLFTEDLDRRRLARNEGTRTRTTGVWAGGGGCKGESRIRGGGTVTENYEESERASERKGRRDEGTRKKELSLGGVATARGRRANEGKKKDSRILEARSRVVGWSNNRAALNTVIPALSPGLNEGRGRRRRQAPRETWRGGGRENRGKGKGEERGEGGGGGTEAKDDELRAERRTEGPGGSGWSLVVRVPPCSGGYRQDGMGGMITFVSYLTLERAG